MYSTVNGNIQVLVFIMPFIKSLSLINAPEVAFRSFEAFEFIYIHLSRLGGNRFPVSRSRWRPGFHILRSSGILPTGRLAVLS